MNNAKSKSELPVIPELKGATKNVGQKDEKKEKGSIPSHHEMFATADKNQKKVEQPQKGKPIS